MTRVNRQQQDPGSRRPAGCVPTRRRFQIAVALGLLAGLRAYLIASTTERSRDFGQVWYAARAVLRGVDPYVLIGPGNAFEWPAPFFYPLTAAVAAIPLAPLPEVWASAAFTAFGGACFAWALMQHGYAPLLGFMSAAMVFAAELAQWSPVLAAAVVLPPLSVLYAAKPTIGTAMFIARPSWWAVGGAVPLLAIAFLLQPDWMSGWTRALATQSVPQPDVFPYLAPALSPGGFLALACVARWRRPEARLVAALSLLPQTPMLYEAVPLFLVPRTILETAAMVVVSYVAMTFAAVGAAGDSAMAAAARWNVLLLFLPPTLMVLRRPNQGTLPAWLERRIARWPGWLRGNPGDG